MIYAFKGCKYLFLVFDHEGRQRDTFRTLHIPSSLPETTGTARTFGHHILPLAAHLPGRAVR
jgi:hypothetical protein